MTELLLNQPLDLDRYQERDDRAAAALAADFGYEVVTDAPVTALRNAAGTVMAFYHPFEAMGPAPGPRVDAMHQHSPGHRSSTTFELVRRPGNVAAELLPT